MVPMFIKFGRMVTYLKWHPAINLPDPLVTCIARSRDNLKPFYIYYCRANVFQTWQSGDLP